MTYTQHGHRIAGTPMEPGPPAAVRHCGGPAVCPTCKEDADKALGRTTASMTSLNEAMTIQAQARQHVADYFNGKSEKTDTFTMTTDHVYVVWFCKTLQNWKALCSTTVPDGMYYELTFNGNTDEVYLDAYKKFDNVAIKV